MMVKKARNRKMKRFMQILKVVSLAVVFCGFEAVAAGTAGKLNADGEWSTKVTVKRGQSHTFWVDGLSYDTGVFSIDVTGEFTYRDEDGEPWEDYVYASESVEVVDEDGTVTAIYVLLTPDDWTFADNVPSSVKFTVTVSGSYDEDVAANNKFTFHHSDGDADYPGEIEPPEPAVPVGADSDHAEAFLPKETGTPERTDTCGKVSKSLLAEYGYVYNLRTTSNLVAGRKYLFGLAADNGVSMKMTTKNGSFDLLGDLKSYTNVWTDCSEAYEFVPDSAETYYFELLGGSAASFNFRHAVLPVRKPEEHGPTPLVEGVASDEFNPGYLNNPASGAYDDIIDDKLFKFTAGEKGARYVFRTEGADSPLRMRIYDKNGNFKKENLMVADGDNNVALTWTTSTKNEVLYIGVCQQLEDDEEPSAGPVTLIARKVSQETQTEALNVALASSSMSPFDVEGVVPSSPHSLGATVWTDTYTIAGRKDVSYSIKARLSEDGTDNGLQLVATVYQMVSTRKIVLASTDDQIDPASAATALSFTPSANGTIYIEVSVADGTWGAGQGLAYGPYEIGAVAIGEYGVLKVDMKGAPNSSMGWKIIKKDDKSVTGEDFYPSGSTAILSAGKYTLAAREVKGFAKPDATKGFGSYDVTVGETKVVTYKYTDTADPLDNAPDAKAIEPSTKSKYAPSKLDPKSGKPATVARTLWTDDSEDWYTVAASAGCYYRFLLAEKIGAPKMTVYGPDNWTTELEKGDFVIFDDPESKLQVFAAAKGTYYVKVSHLDDASRTDSSYTLEASMANPGLVKFAKTDVSAKDSAAYVDLSVSRTGKDGLVRVKYRTVGAQTDKDDAYYYPTNGVLEWAEGDNKAKTVRVRLVPNDGWASNKVVKVVLEPFATDDDTFNKDAEYSASFDVDKQGKVLDTATITITAAAKKAPGTVRAVCGDPKKPVFTVTAGETVEIPFERVLGADGIVGVKVETVKGTANKSGEVDFTPVVVTNVWAEGETDVRTVSVETKAVAGDYTGVKTFALKLTALASAKNDPVQYDKPTIASSSVTVNIANEKFADTMANYAKTVTAALDGYTLKEGKAGTWVVNADGTFTAPNKGDLTFAFSTTGTFKYVVDGMEKTFVATAKDKTLTEKGAGSFEIVSYELDGTPVALRQGVKYVASFGSEGTVKSSKLPDGLKLAQDKVTKEWILQGVPSKAGFYQTSYTKVVGTTSTDEVVCYSVAAEGTAAGTFNGLATTFDTTNGIPTLASVTITAALGGKLSAKVMIAGKSYAFTDTGYSYVTESSDADTPVYVTGELALVQKVGSGATVQTVTNRLYYTVMDAAEADPDGWYAEGEVEIQMAALPDTKGNGFQEDVWYSGKVCRDSSKMTDKTALASWQAEAAKYAGYYTVSLVAPDAMPGEPRGSGYMTMTLDAKGKAKLAGKLADGTAYSVSAVAALVGEADSPVIRVPFYACKGTSVFGGWLSIRENDAGDLVAEIDSPDTDIVWKNDDPLSTRDGEEGYALYLQPVGGWYDTVSNLQRSYLESDLAVNLPEGEDALEEIMDALALGGGYAFVAQPSGQAVDLAGNALSVEKMALAKDASKKLNDWDASSNASNVKLTFKRATGIVSGSFDLWYEGANAKGVMEQKSVTGLKHEGVLILMRGDDGYLEDDVLSSGFFIAPQKIKYTDAKGKTQTRTWNGSYRFDINAVPVERIWTDVE